MSSTSNNSSSILRIELEDIIIYDLLDKCNFYKGKKKREVKVHFTSSKF
jgi:hypothetical protein